LPSDAILPFHIQHVVPNDAHKSLTSHYDAAATLETDFMDTQASTQVSFQNVVITDVDGRAPPNERRAAAVRHIKKKGGAYVQIPHDPQPVNKFANPKVFPSMYPTLFPYGIGGFEDKQRQAKVSFKRQVKFFFNLADRHFQEHYSFLFTTFNIIQRRQALLHTSLKVKKKHFPAITSRFATSSVEAIHRVTEHISCGDFTTVHSEEENSVLNLMKEVQLVTSNVSGSSASRVAMRNEVHALMMQLGLPSF
jgi:hypothetical protein